jgi:hypothetical protein
MASHARALVCSLLGLTPLFAACDEVDAPETESAPAERLGEAQSAITVGEASGAGCSTMSVRGLSLQIIAKANCISPGAFVEVPALSNVSVGDAVFPFLEEPARDAFVSAANARPDLSMTVNSMLRTVAQQYLLYHWYQTGQCGIGLAAKPGNSNHETGLALDISQYSAWKSTLQSKGFSWLGSSDPVHFDYAGAGAVSYKGVDVLAFQMLWNEHHPEDPIDADGAWGPQTEARMAASPADGFPGEVTCDAPQPTSTPDVVPAMSIESATDTMSDGASLGVVDTFEDEASSLVLTLTNAGDAPAASVTLAIELDPDFLRAESYRIEHAATESAPFEADPADGAGANPAHDATLPAAFDLDVGSIAPGEIKAVRVRVVALEYSVDAADAVPVHAWVRKVDGLYAQDAFGGDVVNDGSQTFGGGRLEAGLGVDVYSRARWEWDSNRLEGATASDGDSVTPKGGEVVLTAAGDGALVATPGTELQGGPSTRVLLSARRGPGEGAARLLVSSDPGGDLEGAASVELSLPADGELHELSVDASTMPALRGSITRIAFVPWQSGTGEAALAYLRVEGGTVPSPDDPGATGTEDEGGLTGACACSVPGGASADARSASGLGLLALAAAYVRRQATRRRRRAAKASPMAPSATPNTAAMPPGPRGASPGLSTTGVAEPQAYSARTPISARRVPSS